MFELTEERLTELGANITTREIEQQPKLWLEVLENYEKNREKIDEFLRNIAKKHERIRIIFTGAGTSAFVGETVKPYLMDKMDETKWELTATPTTDILSNPAAFLRKNVPTLLVSFARSGNSPESVATVSLAKQLVDDLYQLTITCAESGKLALNAAGDAKNLLLLQPTLSNDKGFAMTSSFTCMTLSTLLLFDNISMKEKRQIVDVIHQMAKAVMEKVDEIEAILAPDFSRVVYLGSGSLAALTREASLKILELTAGKVATLFDSSLGFRHGPKSFVDDETLIFVFTSNDVYTQQYDLDILNEIQGDGIAKNVYSITTNTEGRFKGNKIIYPEIGTTVPDGYLTLPYIVFGQMVSVLAAIKVNNTPDTPSATGTVNRVVQGVVIHEFKQQDEFEEKVM